MAWPEKIYVATRSNGVYFTDDFMDPNTQPTWTLINNGLDNTKCLEFWLDPFNPENKQYVLNGYGVDTTLRNLYRRDNEGSWNSILTISQVNALVSKTGTTIWGFCTDPSTEGRLWALVGSTSFADDVEGYWALYSNNYGATWNVTTKLVNGIFTYGAGAILANGNNVWGIVSYGAGNVGRLYYSYNGGSSWDNISLGAGGNNASIHHNPLYSGRVYYADQTLDTTLRRLDSGAVTYLNGELRYDHDVMWFDKSNPLHQRCIDPDRHLLVTDNGWSSYSDIGLIGNINSISENWGDNEKMLIGVEAFGGDDDVIHTVDGETTTTTGIAGTYPNNIPYNCGQVCRHGVQGVGHRIVSEVYTYDVAFEEEPTGGSVYVFGVDLGEDGSGNKVSVQNVEME